jgi:hypothetical protein
MCALSDVIMSVIVLMPLRDTLLALQTTKMFVLFGDEGMTRAEDVWTVEMIRDVLPPQHYDGKG